MAMRFADECKCCGSCTGQGHLSCIEQQSCLVLALCSWQQYVGLCRPPAIWLFLVEGLRSDDTTGIRWSLQR